MSVPTSGCALPTHGSVGLTTLRIDSAAGMLNIPVSIFAHPLYHLVQVPSQSGSRWRCCSGGSVELYRLECLTYVTRLLARDHIAHILCDCGCAFRSSSSLRQSRYSMPDSVQVHSGILVSSDVPHFILFLLLPLPFQKPKELPQACLPRITLVSVVVSWAIFLVIALSHFRRSIRLERLTAPCPLVRSLRALLLFVTIYACSCI